MQTKLAFIDDSAEVGNSDVDRKLLDQLLTDSQQYKTSEDYLKLMEFATRIRNVAPFNAMLLNLQKPGMTYVASAYDWLNEFNRKVKEDARPLRILWPFAPVVTVYDVQDTFDVHEPDSEGLPPHMTTFFSSGDMTQSRIKGFQKLLNKKDIELKWVDHGDADAGRIQRLSKTEQSEDDPDTEVTRHSYKIKLNQNHSLAVQFTTLAHELAHLCLGHLGPNTKLQIPKRRSLTHPEVEVEAESVAYLVCKRNGVDAKSEAYLSGYITDRSSFESIDLYQIMRAAGQVEALLDLSEHTKFGEPKSKKRRKSDE